MSQTILLKGVSSSPSSTMQKNSAISRRNDRMCRSSSVGNKVDERGAIHKHGKKAAAAAFQELEDVAVDDQLKNARLDGEADCMWLSLDCKSPLCGFNDHILWDICELESNDLPFDKWCSSLLSRSSDFSLGKGTHFFDGSKVSPIDEASLVLERTSNSAESVGCEDPNEKEVVDWLLNSAANCLKSTSFSSSESVDSQYESSLFEGSSVCSSAWTSLGTLDDASFLIREFDQAGIQLLDLDSEDSEWVSDKDSEFDVLHSDSLYPSYNVKETFEVGSSQCDSFPSVQQKHEEFSHTLPSLSVSEATNQGDVNTDEPLFWPFGQKIEWNDEIASNSFCISPRKSEMKIVSCRTLHTPRSTGLRLNERKKDLIKGERKRRIMFNSGSKPECKNIQGEMFIRRRSILSARLSRSVTGSMNKVLPEMKDKKEELTNDMVQSKALVNDFEFLEKCLVSNEDIPIETLIGLNEFDGHEGVDAEFNQDHFC